MANVKQDLLAAGCPPEIADKLAPKVGGPLDPKVGGLFGNLAFLRKLFALYQKDGALVREVLPVIIALVQSGDYSGLFDLVAQRGAEVWGVVTDVIELFDLNPAPNAA